MGADSGRAVVRSARGETGRVEAIDRVAVGARKGDVRATARLVPADPEVEAAVVREVREHALLLVDDPVAERPEKLLVETPCSIPVADVHGHVLDHFGSSPRRYSRRA